MNNLSIIKLVLSLFTLMGLSSSSISALERHPPLSIPIDELVKETMQMNEDGNSVNLVWYIPLEALGLPPQPVLLVAVIKGTMSPSGDVLFASEVDAQRDLKVIYTDSDGIPQELVSAPKSADVSGFITEIKPFLSKMAGPLGEGMWIFAYKNVDNLQNQIVSPYKVGNLTIYSGIQENQHKISLPLNSLFVPRLCPGNKPAHISWKYCPWDGTPLPSE